MSLLSAATIVTEANNFIPDNTTGLVSPEDVRQRVLDLADSSWNKVDNPLATALELANLTETAGRIFSPAQLKDASHTSSDLDGDTTIELERTADNDRIYMRAGGVDMVEVRGTQVMVGDASTGILVQNGATNLITLDGGLLTTDYTNARNDGTTSKAFYVDGSGNVLYGTITASAGARLQDADNDTYLTVEPTADSDTVEGHAFDGTASRQWLAVDTTGSGIIQFGQVWASNNRIYIDGGNDTINLEAAILNLGDTGDVHMRVDGGTALVELLGGNVKLGAYPATRDDGNTTKALYVDANGVIQYGTVTGAGSGGTSIQDADGDTAVEVERTSDVDTIHLKAATADQVIVTAAEVNIYDGASNSILRATSTFGRTGGDSTNFTAYPTSQYLQASANGIAVLRADLVSGNSRVRLGDYGAAGNNTYLNIDDNGQRVYAYAGGVLQIQAEASGIFLGGTATNYVAITSGTGQFDVYSSGVSSLRVVDEQVRLGTQSSTGIFIDDRDTGDYLRVYSNGIVMLQSIESGATGRLYLGDQLESNPTYLDVDANGDTVNAYAGGNDMLAITSSSTRLGTASSGFSTSATALLGMVGTVEMLRLAGTAAWLGDAQEENNGTYMAVDDTGQSIQAVFGSTVLLEIDKANNHVRTGSGTIYTDVNTSTDTVRLEATNIVLDKHKARTDTEQDYALTLDGSGNLNRAKINAKHCIPVAISAEAEDVEESTSVPTLTMHMPYKFRLEEIHAGFTVAPTGGAATIDLHDGGTTIFSTKITVDAGEKSSHTAATPPVFTAGSTHTIDKGDLLEFFIDVKGTTVPGQGAKVYLIGTIIP